MAVWWGGGGVAFVVVSAPSFIIFGNRTFFLPLIIATWGALVGERGVVRSSHLLLRVSAGYVPFLSHSLCSFLSRAPASLARVKMKVPKLVLERKN